MAGNIKSYKEYHRRLLFMDDERRKYFEEMSKVVSLEDLEKVNILLEVLKKEGRLRALSMYRENGGESMLHVAAKFNQSSDIICALIKVCPDLMTTARKESEDYYGQTALHIAIAKGNVKAVETMLSEILDRSQNVITALLHQMATGVKFANTVMMGELPLSVAALTFNQEMVETLLVNGAEMERKNTKGDTVLHTLIRFAAIYPEHLNRVIETLEFFNDKILEKMVGPLNDNVLRMECDHSDFSYIWFVPNAMDLNPLQLATQLSQPQIFQFILNLPKVYSFLNNHDGLFDMRLYDITEIDTVATEKWASYQRSRRNRLRRHVAPTKADGLAQHKFSNPTQTPSVFNLLNREKTKSVLEMMFDIRGLVAYEFIQHPAVRHIIKAKWLYYRIYYYSWMIFHLLFMTSLTVFSIYNADKYKTPNITVSVETDERQDQFVNVFSYIYLLIGILYMLHEVVHLFFRVKKFTVTQLLNVLHNGSYRIVLSIFSISLILDFILVDAVPGYENIALIIALVTGWWFMVFFLRAHQKFSFFTVMIQKILFGDILRFAILISLFLVAFTAGIYMAFQGTPVAEEDFNTYGTTMLLLFKLMLGLGDIDDLYQARRPWLAIALFVIFVLLTYVLMFNALIAMMSQTCMLVSENRLVQWRVQQLSVIIFFESILPSCMAMLVGTEKHVKRFDPEIKQVIDEKRYYLDIRSIHVEYASAEDIHAVRYKLQTMPFESQQPGYHNFSGTNTTNNYLGNHRYSMSPYRNSIFQSIPENPYNNAPVRRDQASNMPGPSGQGNNPQQDKNAENNSPMFIKRKKSRRDKSPPKQVSDLPDDNVDGQKQIRRKLKKKRIEPEGDINTSYDDQSPGRNFYLNQSHLTVPNIGVPSPGVERRRYNSENGLMDTHIGKVNPQQIPVQPIMQVEQVSRVASQPPQQKPGGLDIGVIADSYM